MTLNLLSILVYPVYFKLFSKIITLVRLFKILLKSAPDNEIQTSILHKSTNSSKLLIKNPEY